MTKTRILIVEDEGIIARDIQRQLHDLGYRSTSIAVSGEEAVELAESWAPGLVLMDIHLAGAMDGIDAAVAIRARFGIPSIFITAYATDGIVERAKRAEPLGYIVKPFDQSNLRTTIEIALHKNRLDAKLRQSEARYRAVVESANDAIVTENAAHQIVGWSPAATRLFGYAESEAIGQPVTMLMPARHHAAYYNDTRHLLDSSLPAATHRVEVEVQHRDSHEISVEVSLARWTTDEGAFITAFIRDTSARRRNEALLRLQSVALNSAANAIVITDRDAMIEWANPAFAQLSGYTLSECLGRNMCDITRSGVHAETFYDGMWHTLRSGNVWAGETTNRRKNGTLWTEEQTITPVKSAEGTITHFISVKRDLTDQKQLQDQFLQAQKMEVVGRLAGGIAHDFNNLLTVINGRSDLGMLDLPDGHAARAEFQEIRDAGERASRLTRQLLAFSRTQVVTPTVVNLHAHVTQSSKMLRRLIGEDIELRITGSGDSGNALIDLGQLEQVLLNLAVNARDAMAHGGTLTIDVHNVDLDETFAPVHGGLVPGPYLLLTVADTGAGMPADIRTRIFEPFFTTKEKGKGTGLGLATVYGIVKHCGGSIEVDSAPGRGTAFSIFLPRTGAAPEVRTHSPALTRGTETILLTEDEASLRVLTARILAAAGYVVRPAANAAEALALLDEHGDAIDLLVTDVIMPGMSGPELAAEATSRYPQLRVLLASGYTGDRLDGHPIADYSRFIAKPYSAADLTRKVRSVIDEPVSLPS